MLCITRKLGQSFDVKFGDATARVTIKPGKGSAVRVNIDAPREVRVLRSELESHETEGSRS